MFYRYNPPHFRTISPLRGHQNTVSLLHKNRYRCENSTPCYFRPTLRGQQNYTILSSRSRYLCVNSALHYLRQPMRGQQNRTILSQDYITGTHIQQLYFQTNRHFLYARIRICRFFMPFTGKGITAL